jgi:phenylalanyl-tRNA synthetase beta subunit
MAFSLVFRAPERTLTDEEINASINEIVRTLESNLHISLRK